MEHVVLCFARLTVKQPRTVVLLLMFLVCRSPLSLSHNAPLSRTQSLSRSSLAIPISLTRALSRSLVISYRNLSLALSQSLSHAIPPSLSRVCCLTQSISLPLVSNPPHTFWQSLSLSHALSCSLVISFRNLST